MNMEKDRLELKMINNLKKCEYGKNLFVYEGNFDSNEWEQMDIIIDEEKDIEYAENCIRHFENMSEEMKQNMCGALIRYCERFREFAIEADDDFEVPEIQQVEDILNYVYFSTIHVEDTEGNSIIGYSIEGSCDWEVEHGLQIIIRDKDILYVGACEGVNVWDEKDSYIDEWNFALSS